MLRHRLFLPEASISSRSYLSVCPRHHCVYPDTAYTGIEDDETGMDPAAEQISKLLQDTIYSPLDANKNEIRLLVVHPGQQDGRLQCALRVVSLSDKPQYETISYVWGNPERSGTIQLDDWIMAIPASSERVLKRFRYRNRPRVLWIDAVCINQKDTEERNIQVSLMARIYSASTGNLIWLGEDDGQTEQAIAFMSLLNNDLASATKDFRDLESVVFKTNGDWKSAPTKIPFSSDWTPLEAFLSSEWFSRLWVFQEAAMAPRSTCFKGDHEVDLMNVLRAIAWLLWYTLELDWFGTMPQLPTLDLMLRLVGPGYAWDKHSDIACDRSQFSLIHLLYMMRNLNASDPRDHVFGILGIFESLHGVVPETLLPDYFASCKEVFRRAVLHSVGQYDQLEFPSYIFHREQEPSDDWASWIPRFDRPEDLTIEPVPFARWRNADGGMPKKIHVDEDDPDLLILHGYILSDSLQTVIPRLGSPSVDDELRFLRMIPECFNEAKCFASQLRNATLVDVLVAGKLDIVEENDCTLDQLLVRFRDFVQTQRRFPYTTLSHDDLDSRSLIDFEQAYANACGARSFFTTFKGRIGLGPLFCKQGDILAILYGHNYPVVLRPHSNHPGDFWIIGEAYVEGLMNEEAVEQHKASGKPDDIIRLR